MWSHQCRWIKIKKSAKYDRDDSGADDFLRSLHSWRVSVSTVRYRLRDDLHEEESVSQCWASLTTWSQSSVIRTYVYAPFLECTIRELISQRLSLLIFVLSHQRKFLQSRWRFDFLLCRVGLTFNDLLPENPKSYDKMRPPKKDGQATTVFFHVTVMGLDSIDETSMVLDLKFSPER